MTRHILAMRKTALSIKLISGQSTNVDTVSGATYSSNGIISAVRNAAQERRPPAAQPPMTRTRRTKRPTPTPRPSSTASATAIAAACIVLKVTASGGELKGIDVIEKNDQDDDYFNDAMEIVEKVKNGKNINVVDTVSGATYSSKGILTALTKH